MLAIILSRNIISKLAVGMRIKLISKMDQIRAWTATVRKMGLYHHEELVMILIYLHLLNP